MHTQHCDTAVDDFHAIICHNVSNCSTTAGIYFSKFCELVCNTLRIHCISDLCKIFCICVIRTALSASTCKLVEYKSFSKECRTAFFEYFSIHRIISCAHIRRKHSGIHQRSSDFQVRLPFCQCHKFCNCIFKETRMHSGRANTSDFLFIYKNTACCVLYFFHIEHCKEGCECTHTIILSVSQYHTAIQSTVAGLSCRNDLKLCGEEIFFLHVIILFQKIDYICFYSLFFLFF